MISPREREIKRVRKRDKKSESKLQVGGNRVAFMKDSYEVEIIEKRLKARIKLKH